MQKKNVGRPKMPEKDKKQQVIYYIPKKSVTKFKEKVKPIENEFK